MIKFNCDYCGKEAYAYPCKYARSKNHFCSSLCNNRFHNPAKNKTLMTTDVREKLRQIHLGTGQNKTYTKTFGRHTHRIIAEQMLGRKLLPGEVVHHIDGNKRNNDPENLMIFSTQAEHAKWHAMMRKGGEANAVHT